MTCIAVVISDMAFQPREKGKGKGKRGFGGKGGFGGNAGFGPPTGPILEQPPIYKPEFMKHLPPPHYPPNSEDGELISWHRQLVLFWKSSCYRVDAPESGIQGEVLRALGEKNSARDFENQRRDIVRAGGCPSVYVPSELMLPGPIPSKSGRPANKREKNILEAIKKLQGKESNEGEAKEGEGEGTGDHEIEEEHEMDDGDVGGDDDDLNQYADVEDGMGNDFEDDAGGGGEGEI